MECWRRARHYIASRRYSLANTSVALRNASAMPDLIERELVADCAWRRAHEFRLAVRKHGGRGAEAVVDDAVGPRWEGSGCGLWVARRAGFGIGVRNDDAGVFLTLPVAGIDQFRFLGVARNNMALQRPDDGMKVGWRLPVGSCTCRGNPPPRPTVGTGLPR